jgi:protein-tyrosine phosphatase
VSGGYGGGVQTSPPTRVLPFFELFNFRDVGGYAGLDGRTVRWRRLFRSDALHTLATHPRDHEAFAALGVRTVIDLRRPREVEKFGRVVELPGLTYRHIPPEHPEWAHDEILTSADTPRWLATRYAELAGEGRAGIAEALAVLAEEDSAPVVVHCMAGKDRTGVVCALTLSLLGVSDDDVAADYALSHDASLQLAAAVMKRNPDADSFPDHTLAAPAAAMHLFLDELRARYGSVEAYANLSAEQLAALRSHLLDPPAAAPSRATG